MKNNTSTHNFDVVIAGAGPAGCACAIALALHPAGLRVALLDKQVSPTSKDAQPTTEKTFKVGESLPGAAVRLFKRLGINDINSLLSNADFKPCVGNVSAWGQEHWTHQDALLNPEGGGWHLNRMQFDSALRKRAIALGVTFITGSIRSIQNINDEPANNVHSTIQALNKMTRWHLELSSQSHDQSEMNCVWLVDATGRNSAIGKKLSITKKRIDNQMAALCWLKPIQSDVDNTTRIKSVENGWWYSARLPNQYRVLAFFGLPEQIAKMVKQPSEFTKQCNAANILPFEVDPKQSQTKIQATDAGVSKLDSVCGTGWLAVGDAALSFDPLASQGIFFALYSGIRGAESILSVMGQAHDTFNESANSASEKTDEAMSSYQKQVDNIYYANQNSRNYFYANEKRYFTHQYWHSRLVGA